MNLAIELSSVGVRLGRSFALKDLDLKVPQGSVYGFLGPNGSGKTTTIRTLVGLLRAEHGTVKVLGHDMKLEAPRALLRTGYVPERPHIYPQLTIGETIAYHSAWYPTWDGAWAQSLREAFALDPRAIVKRLSKGETGKLLILLALAQRPDLLVLDEPTDGLDPVVRRDVLGAVLDYVSEANATVFISSHLIHELERICDWVGVLEHGQLIAELPMHMFKEGIKRLRVTNAPAQLPTTPFVVLARANGLGSVEEWVVRGWQPPMQVWFDGIGANLRDVVDLDLEESFVELLRTARAARR